MMLRATRHRRKRNLLILALLVSVIIHLTGIALWDRFARALERIVPRNLTWASRQEPPPQRNVEVIRLERPAAAASRPAHENRVVTVAPHPRPVATLAPAPAKPRHELARLRPNAPAQAPPSAGKTVLAVTPRHAKPVVALAPVPDAKPALSDRQIAQLGEQFSKTIAESRQTLAGVQAASEQAQVTTVRHYTMHFNGIHEGMNPGDGDIFVVQHWRVGDVNWYYVRYTYMYADGTYEADQVPWPVHYPIGDDPFARHDPRVPIQPPPPGYKPDRPLKPILQAFFSDPPSTD
jgi:hypothetical protein